MGQAVLTLLSVALGAAIAGGVALWQVQLVTRRERQARKELRKQEQEDRRAVFQRETILALQDAIDAAWGRTITTVNQYLRVHDDTGQWPDWEARARALAADFGGDLGLMVKLRARVFDDELGRLSHQAGEAMIQVLTSNNHDQAIERMQEVQEVAEAMQRRVNSLLRELF